MRFRFSIGTLLRSFLFFILLVLLLFGPAIAKQSESSSPFHDRYWSLQFENDFFASSGDRYYTHGTQFSLLLMKQPPPWLTTMARLFPAYESDGVIKGVNYTIGQKIFTPDNTHETLYVDNDRPYAGYLFTSAALLSRVGKNELFETGNFLEFTLGVIGPVAMGKEAQTSLHELLGIDSPRGWGNQLQNEPGIGVTYSRFRRTIHPISESFAVGVSPQLTIAVGNIYTYTAAGIMLRLGSSLGSDLSPPNIKPGFPGMPLFLVEDQNSLYFFAGVEVRLVGRNIFLDGNTYQKSHRVEKELFVGDFQFGIVYRLGNLRLSISNMYRTKEYKTQKDETRYGAVNISFVM